MGIYNEGVSDSKTIQLSEEGGRMREKRIAILGLQYVSESEAAGFMDDSSESYKHFRLKKGCKPEIIGEYPKKQYGDQWQFVLTLRRSNRSCTYLARPEEIDELNLGELIAIYITPSCGYQQNSRYANPEKVDFDSVQGAGDWPLAWEEKDKRDYN